MKPDGDAEERADQADDVLQAGDRQERGDALHQPRIAPSTPLTSWSTREQHAGFGEALMTMPVA